MKELYDIEGYWDMSGCYAFNDKDMWKGQILLEDDGWFEGIVVDPNSSYKEDRFIFGVYYPVKVIELYKFTPLSVSAPFVFHGRRDAKGYDGNFETIGLFGPSPCGVSHIITQARDNSDTEIAELEARIQRYKSSIMDDTCKEFYDNSIAMRNSMCKIILRNYENRGFTEEEFMQLMEECQPVTDRVIKSTCDEAKRLIKQMPKQSFDYDDDDDDLPF